MSEVEWGIVVCVCAHNQTRSLQQEPKFKASLDVWRPCLRTNPDVKRGRKQHTNLSLEQGQARSVRGPRAPVEMHRHPQQCSAS